MIYKTTYAVIYVLCSASLVILASGEYIPTNILLRPARILHDKYYVSTDAELLASAEITSDKFKNTNLTYQWTTKDRTIITSWKASQINCTFNKTDENTFLKLLVVQTDDSKNSGNSEKELAVRDPVVIADPIGKLFIQHGELLDIVVKWTGSGPFKFCYKVCPDAYKEDCDNCTPYLDTDSADVKIERYLRYVGNYTFLFKVDNLASVSDKHYTVKVESTFRTQKGTYVPIVSSISAVLILFSGVALHMKFRKTVSMETADFEFLEIAHDEDELIEGDTFCQRIICLLKRPSTYIP